MACAVYNIQHRSNAWDVVLQPILSRKPAIFSPFRLADLLGAVFETGHPPRASSFITGESECLVRLRASDILHTCQSRVSISS